MTTSHSIVMSHLVMSHLLHKIYSPSWTRRAFLSAAVKDSGDPELAKQGVRNREEGSKFLLWWTRMDSVRREPISEPIHSPRWLHDPQQWGRSSTVWFMPHNWICRHGRSRWLHRRVVASQTRQAIECVATYVASAVFCEPRACCGFRRCLTDAS